MLIFFVLLCLILLKFEMETVTIIVLLKFLMFSMRWGRYVWTILVCYMTIGLHCVFEIFHFWFCIGL